MATLSRLTMLPRQGWAPEASGTYDPIIFDPQRDVPPEGLAVMDRVARAAEASRQALDFQNEVHRMLGEDDRGCSVAIFRLMVEFPTDTGVTADQSFPGSFFELQPSSEGPPPLDALWVILRVLVARDRAIAAVANARDEPWEEAIRYFGGELLADRGTALRIARELGVQQASRVFVALREAAQAAAAPAEVGDEVPIISQGSMDAIGPLRLTEHQAEAARPIIAAWRTVKARCASPVTLSSLDPWDDRWREIERVQLWPRAMAIAGAAGVGKSYLLLYLILRLMQEDPELRHVCLTAYTHNAAAVLEQYFSTQLLQILRPKIPSLGIHESSLTLRLPTGERSWPTWSMSIAGRTRHISRPRTLMSSYAGSESNEMVYGKVSPWHLGINDESSMVPRDVKRSLIANAPHPLIFVGDPGQLAAVDDILGGDAFGVLVADGFNGRLAAFGDLMNAPNLRTHGDRAGILGLGHRMRRHVALPPKFQPAEALSIDDRPLSRIQEAIDEFCEQGHGVSRMSENVALQRYVDGYWNADRSGPRSASLMVCGTNRVRSSTNRRIRHLLGFDGEILAPGETLIVETSRRHIVGNGDVSLANNEFVVVTDVLDQEVDVEICELPPPQKSKPQLYDAGEEKPLPLGTMRCVRCVVETATKSRAEILIPHATLHMSSRVRRAWRDTYTLPLQKLKAAAEGYMRLKFGGTQRAKTYATLALWDPERRLEIPNGDGTRWVKTWAELGIDPAFEFRAELRMHYWTGQFRPFHPAQILESRDLGAAEHYNQRDLRIARQMQAWEKSPLVSAHYGYCITGHASQGAQFSWVYAMMEPPGLYHFANANPRIAEKRLQEILRWIYVVATRAQQHLFIISADLGRYDRRRTGQMVSPDAIEAPADLFDETAEDPVAEELDPTPAEALGGLFDDEDPCDDDEARHHEGPLDAPVNLFDEGAQKPVRMAVERLFDDVPGDLFDVS